MRECLEALLGGGMTHAVADIGARVCSCRPTSRGGHPIPCIHCALNCKRERSTRDECGRLRVSETPSEPVAASINCD